MQKIGQAMYAQQQATAGTRGPDVRRRGGPHKTEAANPAPKSRRRHSRASFAKYNQSKSEDRVGAELYTQHQLYLYLCSGELLTPVGGAEGRHGVAEGRNEPVGPCDEAEHG